MGQERSIEYQAEADHMYWRMAQERLEQLLRAAEGARRILILPHNDPDAIASSVALGHLLSERMETESTIAYKGIIGRAENKALERYLVLQPQLW